MRIIGKYPDIRLRRVRNSDWVRRLVSENNLSANDLILPIFVREGKNKIEKIKNMPGIFRYTVDKLSIILNKVKKNKILLVALFPNTLNVIPKSGSWMNAVKVVLGFLELALALKFLSNADLVANWGLLKREVFLVIWILITLSLTLYLFGQFVDGFY